MFLEKIALFCYSTALTPVLGRFYLKISVSVERQKMPEHIDLILPLQEKIIHTYIDKNCI